jgi:hypothetical protein
MKRLLENWRRYIEEQEGDVPDVPAETEEKPDPIQTVGDLRKLIKIKRAKDIGKIGAKRAAIIIGGMLTGPLVGYLFAAKDFGAIIRKFMASTDKVKTNSALDKMNIPDDASTIVDDKLEDEFIKYFMDSLSDLPDSAPIPNAEDHLRDWLASKFSGTTVKK